MSNRPTDKVGLMLVNQARQEETQAFDHSIYKYDVVRGGGSAAPVSSMQIMNST